MENNTSPTPPATNGNGNGESKLFGVSARAILAVGVIGTACYLAATGQQVEEPLYTMSVAALAFYMGQKTLSK